MELDNKCDTWQKKEKRKKELRGGGAVTLVTIDHYIMFQHFNTRAEVSLKLTLKYFLSRER